MKKILELIRKTGTIRGLQIFQLLRFGGFFLTGILLAKGPVSIEQIGIYESLMFLSGAFSFFWISGFLNAMLIRFSKEQEDHQGTYLFNVAAQIAAFNLLLILILFIFKNSLTQLLPDAGIQYYNLLLMYILINNPTFINEYILLLKEKSLTLVIYGILSFLANIIAVIVPVYLGYGLEVVLVSLLLVSVLKLCFLGYLLTIFAKVKIESKIWSAQLQFSTPLILSLLISGSAEYIDGLLVSSHFGADAFAIFRYGARELPFSLLMANALSSAMVPRLSQQSGFSEGIRDLKSEGSKLMHLLFPLTIILLISSKWLYPLVFRPEFSQSAVVFNVFLLLIISRMVFPQSILMALGNTAIIFKIAIFEILINISASYVLMLKFGMLGVAYGTLLAFYSEKALLIWHLHKKEGIQPGLYTNLKIWLGYSILLLICWVFVNNFGR